MDCIFCKIADGEIPSTKVYEDDEVLAFLDLSPVSPVHILIIPKEHIQSAYQVDCSNADIVAKIFCVAAKLAKEQGICESGYRIVTNVGKSGGQTVNHLHFHLIGGRDFSWPPG
ncbi:MAG: histidine triad nucleotide-binding protein [Oscillospiraceae bacterium]|jgi:histidine triad (HIT) family protein|nr:histidine triad nucleotide-binding protein [Oscillospiraceae bacterium]